MAATSYPNSTEEWTFEMRKKKIRQKETFWRAVKRAWRRHKATHYTP